MLIYFETSARLSNAISTEVKTQSKNLIFIYSDRIEAQLVF